MNRSQCEPDPVERAEQEYREWCRQHMLDPEDTQSMVAYEDYWDEEYER